MKNELKYLDLFSIFAPTYNSAKHGVTLWNLIKYMDFKIIATREMHHLVLKQEQTLSLKYPNLHHPNVKPTEGYREESIQIAYLDAFLASVYSLTEIISKINKVFYDVLPHGFHNQAKRFNKNPTINPELFTLIQKQNWYDTFREVRAESTHFGSGYLFWENGGIRPREGRSFLVLTVQNRKQNKVLTKEEYFFDFNYVNTIFSGIWNFMEEWSKIMIKQIDPNSTTHAIILDKDHKVKKSETVVLKDILEGKVDIEIKNKLLG